MDIINQINQKIQDEKIRKRLFGNIKPILHTKVKNTKIVVVRNKVYYSDKWKTFIDFLFSYIWECFGQDWVKEEFSKTKDRHIILKWWDEVVKSGSKAKNDNDDLVKEEPTGYISSLILLAYDLFVIQNNSELQKYVIDRLKLKEQFQGARYELFATAALIRSGFDIEFEDEKDLSKKHVEFIGVHKTTREKISIEAKSKHRRGVLDFPGNKIDDNKANLRVGKIINQALAKNPNYPLIVFVDLNLHPSRAKDFFSAPLPNHFTKITKNLKRDNNFDLFNIIIFTNHGDHYLKSEVPDSINRTFFIESNFPKYPIKNSEIINSIKEGVSKFGVIPVNFP